MQWPSSWSTPFQSSPIDDNHASSPSSRATSHHGRSKCRRSCRAKSRPLTAFVPTSCPPNDKSDRATGGVSHIGAGQGGWGDWGSNPGPTDYECSRSRVGRCRVMPLHAKFPLQDKGIRAGRCQTISARFRAFVPALCPPADPFCDHSAATPRSTMSCRTIGWSACGYR